MVVEGERVGPGQSCSCQGCQRKRGHAVYQRQGSDQGKTTLRPESVLKGRSGLSRNCDDCGEGARGVPFSLADEARCASDRRSDSGLRGVSSGTGF